jgi:hypothetical protein
MKRSLDLYHKAAEFRKAISVHHPYQLDPVQALKLKSAIAKTVIDLEVEILSALDQLLYKSSSIGKEIFLSTWLCLWILILSYKEHMLLIKYFSEHDKKGK